MASASAIHVAQGQPAIAAGGGPLLAGIFALVCFFPYPAIPLGASTGLQLSQLLALFIVPLVVLWRPPWRHILALSLLLGVLLVSAFGALLFEIIIVSDIMIRAMISITLATVILIPAGYIARSTNVLALATGAALAIVVHAAIGLYQDYSFARSTFPLLGWYQNPSFLSMRSVAMDYALYIRRPFGYFPEPSAMTSSVGPWLILLLGLLVHPRWRVLIRPRTRALLIVAIISGAILVLRARSGYAPLWIASMLPVFFYAIFTGRPQRRSVPLMAFVIMAALILFIGSMLFVRAQLSSDAVSRNDSWHARQQSIVIGLSSPSRDPARFIVGYGPGQSATYLQSRSTVELLPSWYESSSAEPVPVVWSILGTLYMETGLLGVMAILGLLLLAIRAIWASSARLLGVCVFSAWLAGVTLTTSYFPLSPIWLMLGLLLAWDWLFARDSILASRPSPVRVRSMPTPRFITGGTG